MRSELRGLRLVPGLSGLLLLSLTWSALGSACKSEPQAGARLFRVKASLNAKYAYTIKTEMKAVGATGKAGFEGTMNETLRSISQKEQIWEVAFKVTKTHESGVLTGLGTSFKQMNGLVMMRYSDSTGQVRKMMIGEVSVPNSGTSDLVYSGKPVRVGDSWNSRIVASGITADVTYKLVEYGKHRGFDAAKITGIYKPGQEVKNLKPLIFWVDPKDGKLLSTSGALQITTQGSTIEMSFDIARVKKASG
jgi:hypothetical protein